MKNKKRLQCYVRSYRLRWGFSQAELAFIIGTTRNYISYLEAEKRRPKLSDAFALQVIFGVAFVELFPRLFAETEDDVLARAYDLYEQLQGHPSGKTRIKLDFLEEMFERAKRKSKSTTHA
jgi:transcriptional regulator with XRE-family HTH domain